MPAVCPRPISWPDPDRRRGDRCRPSVSASWRPAPRSATASSPAAPPSISNASEAASAGTARARCRDLPLGLPRRRHPRPARVRRRHVARPPSPRPSARPTPSCGPPSTSTSGPRPASDAKKIGVLDGRREGPGHRPQDRRARRVVIDGKSRWVTVGYLSRGEARDPAGRPRRWQPCPNGSVAAGDRPNVVYVYRAVCAAFPEITSYGALGGDGEHSQGIAIDIMVSGELRQAVAEFLRAHAAELGLTTSSTASRSGPWSAAARAGGAWRTAGPPPPTTTTTSTSRRTELTPDLVVSFRAPAQPGGARAPSGQ